jgi:HEAT repeat protein
MLASSSSCVRLLVFIAVCTSVLILPRARALLAQPPSAEESRSEQRVDILLLRLESSDAQVRQAAVFDIAESGELPIALIDNLVALLSDPHPEPRWAAAWKLTQLGERNVDRVGARLKDPQVETRRTASYVLAKLVPACLAAQRLLLPMVADPDPLVRQNASAALRLLPDRRDELRVERHALRLALLKRVELPDNFRPALYPYSHITSEAWTVIRRNLGPVEPAEATGLIGLLDDPAHATRVAACLQLSELGPQAAAATPKLAELLESQVLVADAAFVTLIAIGADAHGATGTVTRRLTRIRTEPEAGFRKEAKLLGQFGPEAKEAIPALLAIALENHGKARRDIKIGHEEAVTALAAIAAEPPAELLDLLGHSSPLKREAAAKALGAFGPRAAPAVPRLIEQLRDANPFTALAALVALEQIGPPAAAAIPVLAAIAHKRDTGGTEFFLKHRDETPGRNYYHPRLIQVLGKLGPEAIPDLVKFLNDHDEFAHRNRHDAAIGLGSLGKGARAAIPQLIAATSDKDYHTSVAAVTALGAIGPDAKEALPALIDLHCRETRRESTQEILTALVRIAPQDEQVQKALRGELQTKPSMFFGPAVPQVLFDAGLLTDEELWKHMGVVKSAVEPTKATWRQFAPERLPVLLRALADKENATRRRFAAVALGQADLTRHPEILTAWAAQLDDETARNMLIFGKSRGEGTPRNIAVPALIEQLSSPSEPHRRFAAELLGMHFLWSLSPEQQATLRKFVTTPPPHAADAAKLLEKAMTYRRMPLQVRTYPELVELAASKPDSNLFQELAIYGPPATPVLLRLALNKQAPRPLRIKALQSLSGLRGDAQARADLDQLRNDAKEVPAIRTAADAAYQALGK